MYRLVVILVCLFSSLSITAQDKLTSQDIINRAIKKHGGKHYQNASYTYKFRNHEYVYHRNEGSYRYERYNPKTQFRDILTNNGLSRYKQDEQIELTTKDRDKYAESVNSVNYFTFLPYFLHDQAVNHRLLGTTEILGKTYFEIEVTFDKEGGGKDHDDIYMYWIHSDDFTVDYLAYSFHVNGGGVRFRSAYNRRNIDGIIFQDYINHKHDKNTAVSKLDELYQSGSLTELSRIELTDIRSVKS